MLKKKKNKGIELREGTDLSGQDAIRGIQGLPATALQLLHCATFRAAPTSPDACQDVHKLPVSLNHDTAN